jgi:hypothetical protein
VTSLQEHQRRVDSDLLAAAANKARREASQGQAENAVGRGPIVPYDRYVFVGLLDELSLSVARGDAPAGVRRLAVELAGKIIAEPDQRGG